MTLNLNNSSKKSASQNGIWIENKIFFSFYKDLKYYRYEKLLDKKLCLRFDFRFYRLTFVLQNSLLNRLSNICCRGVVNNVNIIVFLKLCSIQCFKYENYTLNKTEIPDGNSLHLEKWSKIGKQNFNVYYVHWANRIFPMKWPWDYGSQFYSIKVSLSAFCIKW